MRLGNLITGALMIKLLAAVVKKSRENDRDIFDMLKEYNDSLQGKNGSNGSTGNVSPPPVHSGVVRPVPAKPDMGVPDYFTPYEGADMTCAEADAAGFEFIGSNKLCYHLEDIFGYISDGSKGIKACVITGWHGSDTIVKVPRTINGRPVVSIEKEAFKGSPIDEIYLPDTVRVINEMAFMKSALTYARLSKNLYRIKDRAFCGCNLLERVYLGNVLHIGKQAFYDCKALSGIRLPDSVSHLRDSAFMGSSLQKIYWKDIERADDNVVAATPFSAKNDCIILGGTLQKCTVSNVDEVVIDDPTVTRIGAEAFCAAKVKKVTLSDKVHTIGMCAFFNNRSLWQEIKEVYAPGVRSCGEFCFERIRRVTVNETEYFHIEEHSFKGTNMEKTYAIDGSGYYCTMVRNTLAFVGENYDKGLDSGILTLSGDTLVMDGSVHFTAAKRIPCLGAKKLLLSRNIKHIYSFHSIEDFEEIIFQKPGLSVRKILPYRPKKSVTLRYKFKSDSAVLLYLPNVVKDSAEAQRLYAFYDRCFKCVPSIYDYFFNFDFDLYDREILNVVSSYRARFTIARLRLEGDHELKPEARERYENFLRVHKRKAEFTAKKHGDTALLSLLEKLSEKNNDPKGDLQK